MLLSFLDVNLLCEKCQVFELQMKEKKTVRKFECEVRRNTVFQHLKEHLERLKVKRGRDRVDNLLGW